MTNIIDNDFHPVDSDMSATDDHWGTQLDVPEARPLASLGGRSLVEANNPKLGPSDSELRNRTKQMERQRRNNAR